MTKTRTFLFLQGPQGAFFYRLGQELRARGHNVFRINLNGGDKRDWPHADMDYRGRASDWPAVFDDFLVKNAITDVLLFGDCRPLHVAAHGMAKLRGVAIHVFEEGYLRPDWVTMEIDGVNGYSTLPRDPAWLLKQAQSLPLVPKLAGLPANFKRRAFEAYFYYQAATLGRWRFPFYQSHRPGLIYGEAFGWMWKYVRRKRTARQTLQGLEQLNDKPYFILPLQLSNDYQIRTHSPFGNMWVAASYIIRSFAQHAPADAVLVIKEHPLESSFFDWRGFVRRNARRLGLKGRLIHIAGGDLSALCEKSQGMVTVNSTSGAFALAAGQPVIVLGSAIYDIPQITHQGALDSFWPAPQKPDPAVYDAFVRVLHDRCLVRGGFASEEGVTALIESVLARLLR